MALYSQGQSWVASFLAGALAGCWFLASNLRAMGRLRASNRALVLGAVGTLAPFGVGDLMAGKPSYGLPLLSSLAVWVIADLVQGEDHRRRIAAGARRQSASRVVGVSFVALVVTLAIAIPIALLLRV